MKKPRGLKVFLLCDCSRKEGLGHFRRLVFFHDQLQRRLRAAYTFLIPPSPEFSQVRRIVKGQTGLGTWPFEPAKASFWKRVGGAGLVVADSYSLKPEILSEWRDEIGGAIVVIDDLNRKFEAADMVISPNVPKDGNGPLAERRNRQWILRGEKYFVLDRRYEKLHKQKRKLSPKPRHVLISIGGSPSPGLLSRMVEGLKAKGGQRLRFRVMRGPFTAPRKQKLSSPDVCDQLLWADIAIISGGVTKYEAAALGTPSLIVAQHQAQLPFVRPFIEKRAAIGLGLGRSFSKESLKKKLGLFNDYSFRRRLSARAKKLVDGRGFERIWPILQKVIRRNQAQ